MRHTQASMSLYYAKAIPKSVAEEVDKLTKRLLAKSDLQPGTPPTEAPKLKAIR